jgi:hypothetical protein
VVLFKALVGYISGGNRGIMKKEHQVKISFSGTPKHKTGMLTLTAICCRRILSYENIRKFLSWWRSQWIVIKLYWLIKFANNIWPYLLI